MGSRLWGLSSTGSDLSLVAISLPQKTIGTTPRICPMNLYDVSVSQLKKDRGCSKSKMGRAFDEQNQQRVQSNVLPRPRRKQSAKQYKRRTEPGYATPGRLHKSIAASA
jgi:hypothetical protein